MRENQPQSSRQIYIWMFQAAALVALLGFVWFLTREKTYRDIDVAKVAAELSGNFMSDTVQPVDNAIKLKKCFDLEANAFAGWAYYEPDSNMDAAELLLLHLKDRSQLTEVQEKLAERLAYQKSRFENYGVDQMELLTSAQVVVCGDYVLWIVSKDVTKVKAAFLSAVEP